MICTNIELYRQYKKTTSLLSYEVKSELIKKGLKYKIIRSEIEEAWSITNRIYLKLCTAHSSTCIDKRRIGELSAKLYEYRLNLNKE